MARPSFQRRLSKTNVTSTMSDDNISVASTRSSTSSSKARFVPSNVFQPWNKGFHVVKKANKDESDAQSDVSDTSLTKVIPLPAAYMKKTVPKGNNNNNGINTRKSSIQAIKSRRDKQEAELLRLVRLAKKANGPPTFTYSALRTTPPPPPPPQKQQQQQHGLDTTSMPFSTQGNQCDHQSVQQDDMNVNHPDMVQQKLTPMLRKNPPLARGRRIPPPPPPPASTKTTTTTLPPQLNYLCDNDDDDDEMSQSDHSINSTNHSFVSNYKNKTAKRVSFQLDPPEDLLRSKSLSPPLRALSSQQRNNRGVDIIILKRKCWSNGNAFSTNQSQKLSENNDNCPTLSTRSKCGSVSSTTASLSGRHSFHTSINRGHWGLGNHSFDTNEVNPPLAKKGSFRNLKQKKKKKNKSKTKNHKGVMETAKTGTTNDENKKPPASYQNNNVPFWKRHVIFRLMPTQKAKSSSSSLSSSNFATASRMKQVSSSATTSTSTITAMKKKSSAASSSTSNNVRPIVGSNNSVTNQEQNPYSQSIAAILNHIESTKQNNNNINFDDDVAIHPRQRQPFFNTMEQQRIEI